MKQHYVLINNAGEIQDILEVNPGEFIHAAPAGMEWVHLDKVNRNFLKDPEKFAVDKAAKIKESVKKPVITLVPAAPYRDVFVNDVLRFTVSIDDKNKTISNVMFNIDGNQVTLVENDTINLTMVNEGTYKIYCEDRGYYFKPLYINVQLKL